jgi:RNA polymerase sigma factor (TIGR02999 family)
MPGVTNQLQTAQPFKPKAASDLLPMVYEELRKLAAFKLANEANAGTFQPTSLVHEAWLRLVGAENPKFENRAHFFAAAAEAMRRILIDHARRKRTARHGGGQERVNIENLELASPGSDEEMLAVHDALDKLSAQNARKADLVKLRYFAGLTLEECAKTLGISETTAKRDWAYARAWLYNEIAGPGN